MRLSEIINFTPVNTNSKRDAFSNRVKTMTKAKEIGSGLFGSVIDTKSKKRNNQVTKMGVAGRLTNVGEVGYKGGDVIYTSSIEEDGYLSYLKAVFDYEQAGGSCKFFPKVEHLKIRRHNDTTLSYVVYLEELKHTLGYTVDKLSYITSLYISMFHSSMYPPKYEAVYTLQDILDELERAVHTKNYSFIKDKELIKVLQLIENVLNRSPHLRLDVHIFNVMWRENGPTPQLVIIDPLA